MLVFHTPVTAACWFILAKTQFGQHIYAIGGSFEAALRAGIPVQRTLIKVYWEAKAKGLDALTEALYWRYLSDETIHREQVELVLDENRELYTEFNDRLMRFAHLSPEAAALALAFTEE